MDKKEDKQHLYVDTVVRVNGDPVTVSSKFEMGDIAAMTGVYEVGRTTLSIDFSNVQEMEYWLQEVTKSVANIKKTLDNAPKK